MYCVIPIPLFPQLFQMFIFVRQDHATVVGLYPV